MKWSESKGKRCLDSLFCSGDMIDNNYHNFMLLGSFNKSQCELVVYSRSLDLDLGPGLDLARLARLDQVYSCRPV